MVMASPYSGSAAGLPLRRRVGGGNISSSSRSQRTRYLFIGTAMAFCALLSFTKFSSSSATNPQNDRSLDGQSEEDAMKIAVIAWGSLAWQFIQPGRDKLQVVGDTERLPGYEDTASFQPGGPSLPLEFSRVSLDGRLTLVITPNADPQETLFATHQSSDLQEAIRNLKRREMPIHDDRPESSFSKTAIGYVDLKHNQSQTHLKSVKSIIKEWCIQNNFDAAIWWDAPSNFKDKKGKEFDLEEGVKHLYSLKGEKRDNAIQYIRNSPVDTGSGIKAVVEDAFDY